MIKPFLNYPVFFLFMYILGSLCIYFTTERGYAPFFYKLYLELFFDIYALCCILSFLPSKSRSLVSNILASIFYTLAIIDLFCYIRLGSTFSPGILQLILNTNTGEAEEFFSSYISLEILLSPIGYILLLICIHIATCLCLNNNYNHYKNSYIINVAITIFVIIGFVSGLKNKWYIIKTWEYKTIGQVEQYFSNEYYARRAQYLPIHRFIFAIHANSLSKNELHMLQHTINNTVIGPCKYTSPTIVLIIGESYNKHHSQLYGYPYKTTPKQLTRMENKELFVYTDAVTPFNITSEVLKNAFSLNDISNNEPWYDKPLFTNIFKKAGYHVTFLSNEFIIHQQKSMADFSAGMFLNNPIISNQQFDIRNTDVHQYDEGLINDYKILCKGNTLEHKLIIFSLIGQHIEYADRFPLDFSIIQKKDYQRHDLNDKQLQVVVDYDNATLYNDYIVDSIIKLFEKQDAIVIYMPDHGDECYDQMKTSGRQHCDPVSKIVAINEYQIPFWIWCSNRYKKQHPDIIKQIEYSTERRFYSDDLPHLLLYLAGISSPDYRESYNILSPYYDTNRKRILKKRTNYDEIVNNKK